MTDAHETLSPEEAIEEGDVTLALTPAQLVAVAIGLWLLYRFIRSLRG